MSSYPYDIFALSYNLHIGLPSSKEPLLCSLVQRDRGDCAAGNALFNFHVVDTPDPIIYHLRPELHAPSRHLRHHSPHIG